MNKLLLIASLAFGASLAEAQTVVPPGTTITAASFTRNDAELAVAEVSDFTATADTAGSLGGTYIKFYDPNAVCYAPWFDVDDGDVAPTVTGCTVVEIDIAADDTDSTVAGALRTALNTAPYTTYFTITGATTHLIVTSVLKGVATDGNIGTSGFTVSKTQGVSGELAILAASIIPGVRGWRICNDIVNTSTWLAIGENLLDPGVDGARIGKGQCLDCPSCTAGQLAAARVSAQAAANGYTVIQFK